MAESIIQVTEGSGKKLHTYQRTIGANNVEDELVIPGEHYLATYTVRFSGVSTATANDHVIAVWAGASLNVRIRRIVFRQTVVAGATNYCLMELFRTITVTPSGGTAVTPGKMDNADAASGASAMTQPTTKGTETGAALWEFPFDCMAARPLGIEQRWEQHPQSKPFIIPAGITNGFALKVTTAVAGAAITGNIEFVETSFL